MLKKEVQALVAEMVTSKRERLALQAKADKMEEREKTIMGQLVAAKVQSDKYGPYLVELVPKKAPRVTDWSVFHPYILSSGNIDMLTKHLTPTAILARIDAGEFVPGVVVDDKPTYKVSAA